MKPPVQQELKLSRRQINQLRPIHRKYQSDVMQLFSDISSDAAVQDAASLPTKLQELTETAEAAAEEVLTREQIVRLQQLWLQHRGGHALTDDAVAEQLELTDEQRRTVGRIEARTAGEMQRLATSEMQDLASFGNPFEMQKVFLEKQQQAEELGRKLQKKWKESGDELLDVLSREQQEQWNEMTGEPFEFEEP